MKTLLIFILLGLPVFSVNAYIRYRPSQWCRDCYGRPRYPGETYFDGCNQCRCGWNWRAACSYRWCYYNECFKRGRGRLDY